MQMTVYRIFDNGQFFGLKQVWGVSESFAYLYIDHPARLQKFVHVTDNVVRFIHLFAVGKSFYWIIC